MPHLQLQLDKKQLRINTQKIYQQNANKTGQETCIALVTEYKTKYLKILLNLEDQACESFILLN